MSDRATTEQLLLHRTRHARVADEQVVRVLVHRGITRAPLPRWQSRNRGDSGANAGTVSLISIIDLLSSP
jgi:hypothetical protein